MCVYTHFVFFNCSRGGVRKDAKRNKIEARDAMRFVFSLPIRNTNQQLERAHHENFYFSAPSAGHFVFGLCCSEALVLAFPLHNFLIACELPG